MLNYSGCSVSSDYEYRFIIGYFYFPNYHVLHSKNYYNVDVVVAIVLNIRMVNDD